MNKHLDDETVIYLLNVKDCYLIVTFLKNQYPNVTFFGLTSNVSYRPLAFKVEKFPKFFLTTQKAVKPAYTVHKSSMISVSARTMFTMEDVNIQFSCV